MTSWSGAATPAWAVGPSLDCVPLEMKLSPIRHDILESLLQQFSFIITETDTWD